MNIAIVYDRVNKFGGAEQVLLALHQIWPDAPLYTAVYNKKTAQWADVFRVNTSFLQHIPFAATHHELFPWLTPLAFETFDFDQYDVVLSVTSAEAKACITKTHTKHICYCLTPTRYLWSANEFYASSPGLGALSSAASFVLRSITGILQRWDFYAAQRPDKYIAISSLVKERIETYYKRSVDAVIYPPVDTDFFVPSKNKENIQSSYLVVSRFVSYKRIDLVIEACNILQLPLIVIGKGKDEKRLRSMAGPTITIISDHISREQLREYYQQCRAFIFAGEEDFGIVAVEAQACGKSVLCYKKSGMSDIIRSGKTGDFFEKQTVEDLVHALKNFSPHNYKSELCRANALRFNSKHFKSAIKHFIEQNLSLD